MRAVLSGRRRSAVLIGALALIAAAGCTSNSGAASSGTGRVGQTMPAEGASSTASTSSTPTAPPVQLTNSASGKAISPTTPVTIGAVDGKLTSVTMVNPAGRKVDGELAPDGSSWHTTEVLGYAKTYRVTAVATDKLGASVTEHTTVTTVTPDNMTLPYLDTVYGSPIQNGGTYGVAMVVNVVFDEQIPNRAAAERALQVTTSPHVDGAWYWLDNSHVHWRPKSYYPSGTKVTVTAKVYGKDLGNGLYGQSDQSVSFSIGRRQLTVADDNAPNAVDKVRVYDGAGRVIRTMNTSMGKHYGTTVNGNYINFFTLDGTYTVLGHENPARMCSDSYGLPVADGGYPCENIPYGTKISTDGIYLHELDNTVWDQDHGYDVSHGCLNLNYENAKWFFEHSLVGDPVVVHGAKGAPTLQVWQGGDWTLSWSQWLQGSALS